MESVQNAFSKFSDDVKLMGSSAFQQQSTHPPPPSSSYSYAPPGSLVTRPQRQSVSLWTCSKLCAVCFVAGIVVGYTLKRRVRRWLSSLARRLKDD